MSDILYPCVRCSIVLVFPAGQETVTCPACGHVNACPRSSREHESLAKLFRAAEDGDADAQVTLAQMYSEGDGVPQSDENCAHWLYQAAVQGNVYAQFNLGTSYKTGEGVPKDPEKAVYWFHRAAEQGDADALFNMGVAYDTGEGVTQDRAEAVRWYRLAAEQGHVGAQINLGYAYYHAHDLASAFQWFMKAAEQGDPDGQYNLAACYVNGRGVSPNLDEARKWLRLAAEQGLEQAVSALNDLPELWQNARRLN